MVPRFSCVIRPEVGRRPCGDDRARVLRHCEKFRAFWAGSFGPVGTFTTRSFEVGSTRETIRLIDYSRVDIHLFVRLENYALRTAGYPGFFFFFFGARDL